MKYYFRKSLLNNYIKSFFVFFLIPMIVLTIFLNVRLYRNLQNEIKTYNRNLMDQTVRNIDSIILDLIASCNDLRFQNIVHTGFQTMENRLRVVDALSKEVSLNPYILQCYLFYPGSDIALCSRGAYSADVLFTNVLRLPEGEADTFLREIEGIVSPRFTTIMAEFSAGSSSFLREKLLFIYPMRTLGNTLSSHLVVEVNQARFAQAISLGSGDYGQIYAFSGLAEQLLSTNGGEILPNALEAIKDGIASGYMDRIEVNKGIYASCHVFSNTDLYIISMEDTTHMLTMFLNKNRWMIFFIALFMLLGLIMSVVTSMHYYQPILKLSQHVKSGADPNESGGNELLYIKEQYDKVNGMRLEFAKDLERQWPIVEERMVMDLLYHGTFELQENDLIFNIVQKQMMGKYYMVVCAATSDRSGRMRKLDKDESVISKVLGGKYLVYSSYLYYYQSLVYLFFFDEPLPDELLDEIGGKIRTYCANQLQCGVVLTRGNLYMTIDQIHTSFLEAVTQLTQRLSNPGASSELKSETINEFFRYEAAYEKLLTEICLKVRIGEDDEIDEMMQKLAQTLEALGAPDYALQMIFFNILNTLIHVIGKSCDAVFSDDVFRINNLSSPDKFVQSLRGLLCDACENVRESRANRRSELAVVIESYLDRHFLDSELSLAALADELNLSQSYLSKYITQHFNASFSEIVTTKRMEYIKHELRNSDKQVSLLAKDAGYTNLSNFMRRFKLLEGMTPGQYRELQGISGKRSSGLD